MVNHREGITRDLQLKDDEEEEETIMEVDERWRRRDEIEGEDK
jgi:hypothetical protein